MKSKSVCFSGHRCIPDSKRDELYKRLLVIIKDLITRGYTDFYAGGALGFDMMAQTAVLDLKREYPLIKLHLVLPYEGYNKSWNRIEKQKLEIILKNAASVEFVCNSYVKWCYFLRNRKMVDQSSVIVYYLTQEKGGTWQTVKYAAVNDLKMIDIEKE